MPPTNQRLKVQVVPTWDYGDEEADVPKHGPEFKIWGETFHCVPALSGETLPNLIRAIGIDGRGAPVNGNPDVLTFMENAIAEEIWIEQEPDIDADDAIPTAAAPMILEACDDLARWRALMRDKKRPVSPERLARIVGDLVGFYTGRPTQPSGS